MGEQASQSEPMNEPRVWKCDGCGSWTDRPVTEDEVLNEWHWVWEAPAWEGETLDSLYCSECR